MEVKSLFYVRRKLSDEFCAESLPWKATNGHVCSDARTREEAEAIAERLNEARKPSVFREEPHCCDEMVYRQIHICEKCRGV